MDVIAISVNTVLIDSLGCFLKPQNLILNYFQEIFKSHDY